MSVDVPLIPGTADLKLDFVVNAMAYYRKRLRALPYEEYLQTRHWRRKKRLALLRAGYKCEKCGVPYFLEVHHLTYERLGDERPEDLIVLCERCHIKEHPEANDG